MVVPDNLGKTEISDLDTANTTSTLARDEFTLVDLVLIAGLLGLRVLRGHHGNGLEQNVLRLDVTGRDVSYISKAVQGRMTSGGASPPLTSSSINVPMNNTLLLVEIFQSLGHLNNYVSGQLLAEVCQTHNLVEKLATRRKFENNVVVLSGFGEFDELDNVGVVKLTHNLDLLEDIRSLITS